MTSIEIQLAYDFGTGVDFGDADPGKSIRNYVSMAADAVLEKFPGADVSVEVGSGNAAEIIEIDGDTDHEDVDTVSGILNDLFVEDWLVVDEEEQEAQAELSAVITVTEAATLYNVGEDTVRKACQRYINETSGGIRCRQSGSTYLILSRDAKARWGNKK